MYDENVKKKKKDIFSYFAQPWRTQFQVKGNVFKRV